MPFDIAAVLDTGPGWNKVRLTSGEIVTLKGDYNWRSNNPGNLEFGPFTKSRGAIGSGATPLGRDRGFAVFPDAETGNNARVALQFESPRYRDLTIEQAISKYAPEFENDSAAYAAHVAAAAGVPVTTKMSDLTQDQRERYAAAQNDFEGMKPGDIYDEQGIRLPPADLNPRPPSLLPNAPLVAGSYPGPNTVRLPALGPSAGPPAQLVPRDIPATRNLLPAIPPSTLGAAPKALPKVPGRSAGDSLALRPMLQPVPAMDAAYDQEQGVMRLPPSPVGEMPTLDGTRAAFGLSPLAAPARKSIPQSFAGQEGSPTPAAPALPAVIRTASLAGSVGLPENVRPVVPSTKPVAVSASDKARAARNAPPAVVSPPPPLAIMPSNLETAQNEQRLMRLRPALPTQLPATWPGIAPTSTVRPAVAPTPLPSPYRPQRAPLRLTVSGAQQRRPVAAQPLPAPALSKAQLYALLTANRSGSNSDAASRVNGSNTRGSGGARSLLD